MDGQYQLRKEYTPLFGKQDVNIRKTYDSEFPTLGSSIKTLTLKIPKVVSEIQDKIVKGKQSNINKEADFQNLLPGYLKGKRPKDMNKDEEKEYKNLRRKFSRMKKHWQNKSK